MILTRKNCILGYKFLTCNLNDNCRIIVNLLLIFLHSYSLLHFLSIITVAKSPPISQRTAKKLSTISETCSKNLATTYEISHLVNASIEISTWFSEPRLAFKASIEAFSSHLFTLINHSDFGQLQLDKPIFQFWQETILPLWNPGFNFAHPVNRTETTIDKTHLILIAGGKPITIHADSRYQLTEILAKSGTNAVAAVDGTFFSLKFLTSNTMIGPVLSQINHQFIPGNDSENQKLTARPLVLISPHAIRYLPFNPAQHNTLAGIQAEMPDVTDAFVAGAWLVRNGQPSSKSSFNGLFGSDAARHRAFWGVNKLRQPTIGVSTKPVDAANLAVILVKAGLREAVMLDSGASTSLAHNGESLVGYVPRPVPHAVALIPPLPRVSTSCLLAFNQTKKRKV
ncbi:MAG: phosphodiester glycosidase family protein [Goleter apudmare HA4340-LM2]|jgi:hypothetical protein|nr:phosphodiester glycosidase family protein [Goleter apudmare HA4340-LM2]